MGTMVEATAMADSRVPADVQSLLLDQLESLDQLEILLLLQRRSLEDWSPQQVADELQMRASVVEEELLVLAERGLLAVVGTAEESRFRYGSVSTELARGVERLAETYAEQRVEVMRLMTAHAIQRLREDALGMFSSALASGKRQS